MTDSTPVDLSDLQLMPDWLKEPSKRTDSKDNHRAKKQEKTAIQVNNRLKEKIGTEVRIETGGAQQIQKKALSKFKHLKASTQS